MNPALAEVSTYHDREAFGYFAVRCDGKQDLHPLSQLPHVLTDVALEHEIFVSQSEFRSPRNRRCTNVLRLPTSFVDCDLYHSDYAGLPPDAAAYAILQHCDDQGIRRPNLLNFSGQGIHAKWPFMEPLPAAAVA